MAKLFNASKKISELIHVNENAIFLFLNIMAWSLMASILFTPVCYLFAKETKELIVSIICAVGYPGVFIGLFGGITYLMGKN